MNRSYTICHIVSSLNGKIAGPFMGTEAAMPVIQEYARIRTEMKGSAWLYGTVTTKEFTGSRKPDLREGPSKQPDLPENPFGGFLLYDECRNSRREYLYAGKVLDDCQVSVLGYFQAEKIRNDIGYGETADHWLPLGIRRKRTRNSSGYLNCYKNTKSS